MRTGWPEGVPLTHEVPFSRQRAGGLFGLRSLLHLVGARKALGSKKSGSFEATLPLLAEDVGLCACRVER